MKPMVNLLTLAFFACLTFAEAAQLEDSQLDQMDVSLLSTNGARFQKGALLPLTPVTFSRRQVQGRFRALPVHSSKTSSAKRSTTSALPGSQGLVQVNYANGSPAYLSNTIGPDGGFLVTSSPLNALSVLLPNSCPSSSFPLSSTSLGIIGASVDPANPLSSGTTSFTPSTTSQQSIIDSTIVLTSTQALLTTNQSLDPIYAAALTCIGALYTQAKARDDAYYSIVAAARAAALALGTILVDTPGETAAQQTATTAYLAASSTGSDAYVAAASIAAGVGFGVCYTAAVALASAQSIAATAIAAAADVAAGRPSNAAAAAIQAASTAAIAAAYLDPTYIPIYGGLRTAFYAPQIQAILNALTLQIGSLHTSISYLTTQVILDQQNLVTSQTTHVAALSGSNSATLIPQPSGTSALSWSLSCSSNALAAAYTNSDGSVVGPVTFYASSIGMDINLTGNYAAAQAMNPIIGQIISLSFLPTN